MAMSADWGIGVALQCLNWKRLAIIVLTLLAWVGVVNVHSANAMSFLAQPLFCEEPEECYLYGSWLKGSTGSEELQTLPFELPAEGAALSSDEQYIAWTEFGGGLYLSDSELRSYRPLIHYEGGEELGMHWVYEEPVFAPDQDIVLFNWDAECLLEFCEPFQILDHEELQAASTAGLGEPDPVPDWPGVRRDPAISSDGGRLAFVGFSGGVQGIWLADLTGGGVTSVVTRADGFEALASPSFAPEGNRLTFEGTRSGVSQVYVVGINGGELTQLTRSGGRRPQWSPGESFVAYISEGGRTIARIDPDTGRELSPLVASPPEPQMRFYRVVLPQPDALRAVHTFEPVLRFDSSERWRPLNVDQFLTEGGHVVCDEEACDESTITSASDLEHRATTDAYIDVFGEYGEGTSSYHTPIGGCVGEGLLDCDAASSSAIYYRVTRPFFEGETGYRYIDYWFFYRANEFASQIDFHEGDWEGVTVAPSASTPGTFDYAAFSQHGRYYSYLRDVLRCEDSEGETEVPAAGTCGTEAEPEGQRISVMVGNGTHANYTTPCSESIPGDCRQNGPGIFDRGYDGQRRWGNAFGSHYATLLPLPPPSPGYEPGEGSDPEAWAAGRHGWADWPGRWGVPGGGVQGDGPLSPLLQGVDIVCASVDNPESFCDGGPRAAAAPRAGRQPLSPGLVAMACRNWIGANIAAALCNPRRLRAAVRRGRVPSRPSQRLGATNQHGRVGAAPGIVQMAGQPLRDRSRVRIRPAAQRGTTLMLRVRGRGRNRHKIYVARFANVAERFGARTAQNAGHTLTLHVATGHVTRASMRLGGVRPIAVKRAS